MKYGQRNFELAYELGIPIWQINKLSVTVYPNPTQLRILALCLSLYLIGMLIQRLKKC